MILSGTCHQDVADILENKTTTKDHLEERAIHRTNNMALNEEFQLGQNQESVLYMALQSEAVTNVLDIVTLSDCDIDHIQFTSVSTGRPVAEALGQAF